MVMMTPIQARHARKLAAKCGHLWALLPNTFGLRDTDAIERATQAHIDRADLSARHVRAPELVAGFQDERAREVKVVSAHDDFRVEASISPLGWVTVCSIDETRYFVGLTLMVSDASMEVPILATGSADCVQAKHVLAMMHLAAEFLESKEIRHVMQALNFDELRAREEAAK